MSRKKREITGAGHYMGAGSLAYDPKCPCNNCEHRDKCADEQLACISFMRYAGCMGQRMINEFTNNPPRIPTKACYDRIFPGNKFVRRTPLFDGLCQSGSSMALVMAAGDKRAWS